MDRESIAKAIALEAAKASPPIAVTAQQPGGFFSWSPITALTCLYLVLQIAYLIWKWRNDRLGQC